MNPTQETIHANLDQLRTVAGMALGNYLACGPADVADALTVQINVATGENNTAAGWLDTAATCKRLADELLRNANDATGCAITCGATYEQVGTALGISRQAAWERFKR